MWEKFSCSKLGCYEKRLLILLALSTIPNPFQVLQSLVLHYTPPYQCALEKAYQDNTTAWNDANLNISESDEKPNSCSYRNKSENTANRNDSAELLCLKFIFDGPEISAVTEFELVCERSWIQPMLISLYFIGKMIGALVGGVFSDKFGRKPTFLIFNALQFIVTIAMSFVSDVTTYAVALFISGGTSLVNFMAANVLGLELVAPQYRSRVYFFTDAGYSIGYMILPLLAYFLRDWRWFLRATGLIGILYVPYYWLIDESPQWLTSVGNNKKAKRIRQKIAKFNGDQNLSNVENVDKPEGDPDQGCLKCSGTVLGEPVLIGRFLILSLAWIMVCMSYYVIALNANNMGGNRFLNIFYGGLTELAASIIFFMSVDVLGRRNSYSVVMSMAAVSIAVTPFLAISSQTAVTVTTMFSKLALSVAFAVIYTYSGELFPTTIRHSILAVLSSMGRVGSMVSPFVIHAGYLFSLIKRKRHYNGLFCVSGDTITPSLITAILIALSAAAVMLLPETRNKTLPQTAQQATAMKRNLPCICSREARYTEAAEVNELRQTDRI